MLSRFFDKTSGDVSGKHQGGETSAENAPMKRQGSLLDSLGDAPLQHRPQNSVVRFPTEAAQPIRSQTSLLSTFDVAEKQAAKDRELAEAALRAERAAGFDARPHSQSEGAVRSTAQPSSSSTASSRSSSEQLDLLADELADLKHKMARSAEVTALAKSANTNRQPDHTHNSSHNHYYSDAGNYTPAPAKDNPFSFDKTLRAVFKASKFIILFAIIGAVLAALYAVTLPNKYESVVEILIEPRELRVLDNTVSPNGLNSEATVAYAESQVRIINSSSVIDPVIEELELTSDAEFTGDLLPNGTIGRFVKLLIGSSDDGSDKVSDVKKYLYANMYVARINQTFTIQIGVSTNEPAKSARVANAIAKSYMQQSSGARSLAAGSASADLTARLGELKAKVRESEESVEAYRAENGLLDADGKLVSEVQLSRLNDQLTLAKVQTGDARTKAQLAKETDLGDVVSGTIPSALSTAALTQLRLEYTKAKSRLAQLSAKLGSRHPDRIAGTAEVQSALSSISQEMTRVIKSAQEEFKRARARESDLRAQVNELKASAVTDAAAKVKLRELERDVTVNRRVYESYLLRSRETSEEQNLKARNARIISEAVPNDEKTGPNRKLIVAGGGLAGGALGAILSLFPFLIGGVRQLATDTLNPTQGGGSSGHYPAPQAPQHAATAHGEGDLFSTGSTTSHAPPPRPVSQPEPVRPAPVAAEVVTQNHQTAQTVQAAPPATQAAQQPPVYQEVAAPMVAQPQTAPAQPQMVPQSAPVQNAQMPLPGMVPGYAQGYPVAQAQPVIQQPVAQPTIQPVYVQAPPMMMQQPVAAPAQPQMVYTTWVQPEQKG